MNQLIIKYLCYGFALFAGGIALVTGGAFGIKSFFEGDSGEDGYSVVEVARGLVLPHVSTLAGIAAVTFGLILFIKGLIFVARHFKESK